MRRLGMVVVLLGIVGAAHVTLSAQFPETVERAQVATLPPVGERWVWVPDRLLQHSLLYDGDSGEVLGMIDSPSQITPKPPVYSRSRGEFYSADLAYARGHRGARTDFVTIYDARTLDVVDDIVIPTRSAESNASLAYVELLGERFLAIFNQFPNVSVSIVDLERRAFVEEIVITGCSGIYPVSERRFATLCGNGTLLQVDLDADGRKRRFVSSEVFFDAVTDPVLMAGGRNQARWTFVSFSGQVHTADFSADTPELAEPWSLVDEAERRRGWRPGGLQPVAVSAATGRLYVLMHEGEPGSHKRAGEVWAWDLASRERVAKFELPNLLLGFIAPVVGIELDGWAARILGWLLPRPGAHSIAVSSGPEPVLFARNAEFGAVAVLDARSGETRRMLTEAGLAGPTLRVP